MGLLLSFDVLLHKERPVSAVLWLAVLWAVPYVGALAYVTFGIDQVRRGGREREAARALLARRAALHPGFERLAVNLARDGELHPAAHIFEVTDPAVRPNRVLRGNRVELLVDGDEFYPKLFRAIRDASESIHLQTYIFARRGIGRALRDLLAERAAAGLEVRLLYDRFGSTAAHFSRFFEPIRRAGGQTHSISQAHPLKGRFQINLRNHRKLAVLDGRIAFVGGINIDDRNLSGARRGPPDRDYHLKLCGPAVRDLQFQFIEDWHFASGCPPDRLLGSSYFPALEPAGEGLAQIVPGGPECEGRGLADAFFGSIVAARESVTILTPYFVPDEPILHALRYAAIRGVRVRIVVPAKNNHWYTGYAARALYSPLLEAGVRIFERDPPFMHAKAMLVDGVYAMLGSANLDYRSLHLNFELNVEVAEPRFLAVLREQVERELAVSREVALHAHRRRPLLRRLTENACLLFQPVL